MFPIPLKIGPYDLDKSQQMVSVLYDKVNSPEFGDETDTLPTKESVALALVTIRILFCADAGLRGLLYSPREFRLADFVT